MISLKRTFCLNCSRKKEMNPTFYGTDQQIDKKYPITSKRKRVMLFSNIWLKVAYSPLSCFVIGVMDSDYRF